MKRFFCVFSILLPIMLTVFLGWLCITQSGLHWMAGRILSNFPEKLSVESLQGRLIGPLAIRGFHFQSRNAEVRAKQIVLDWTPWKLLSRTVAVTQFHGEDISLEIPSGNKKAGSAAGNLPEVRLPLNVVLDGVDLSEISILRTDSGRPLEISHLSFRGTLNRDRLNMERLQMEGPEFTADIAGHLTTDGDYPLDVSVNWELRPPGFSPFKGEGLFQGTLKEVRITQHLEPPGRALLKGKMMDLAGRMTWEASLTLEDLLLRDVNSHWPAIQIQGTAHGKGTPATFNLDGTLDAAGAAIGKLRGDFLVHREEKQWDLNKLTLRTPQRQSLFETTGHLSSQKNQIFCSLEGAWTSLAWPLNANAPTLMSREGKYTLKGSPNDYRLHVETALMGNWIPAGKWILDGRGGLDHVSLDTVRARLLDGRLQGAGSVRWKPGIAWDLQVNTANMNPGAAWPKWPGRLDLKASAKGTLRKGNPHAVLEVASLKGTLRGNPVDARGKFERGGTRYALTPLQIHAGSASVLVNGSLDKTWDLTWQLSVPNLAELLPDAEGTIRGEGRTTGLRSTPTIIAQLEGHEIKQKGNRIADIQADLNVGLQDNRSSTVELKAKGLEFSGENIESVTLVGRGTASSHEFRMKLIGDEEAVDLDVTGSLRKGKWKAVIENAYLASIPLGIWDLERPGSAMVSSTKATVDRLCWSGNDARLCSGAEWNRAAGVQGWIEMTGMPLEILQRQLPPTLEPRGTLNAEARLAYGPDGILRGKANGTIQSSSITYISGIEEPIVLHFDQGSLEVELTEKGLFGQVALVPTKGGNLRGTLSLTPFTPFGLPARRKTLDGQFHATITEPAFVSAFFPDFTDVRGKFTSDLIVGGNLARPLLSGKATLRDGQMDLPRLGIRLNDMNFTVSGQGTESMAFSGKVKSGNGNVVLQGTIGLNPQRGFPSQLTIRGDRFEVVNLPEAWVLASPDLKILFEKHRIDIGGEVVLPEATLHPTDLSGAIRPSRDVVIVGEESEKGREERWKISSHVKLVLGDKVSFNGFGLNGRITGNLTATEKPGRMTTGQGELEVIEGLYKAYGQKLTIERGRLLFAGGPIDDPGLDVRAVRKIGDIVSGVNVRGTLKNPEMELYSSPSLDQSDALSYLVLGHPAEQASGTEGEVLQSAAMAMGLEQGGILAAKIGAPLGLEKVEIEGGATTSDATLFIGKHLSPRFYVSYGIGLFEPVSTFRVRYQITDRWMAQTELGIESGGDLIYKIEK